MNQDLISALTDFFTKEAYGTWREWLLFSLGPIGLGATMSLILNMTFSINFPKWRGRRKALSVTAGGLIGLGVMALEIIGEKHNARAAATDIAAVVVSRQPATLEMTCEYDTPCLEPDILNISLQKRQNDKKIFGRTVEGKTMTIRTVRIPLYQVSKIDSIIAASGSKYTLAQK